MDEKEVVLDEFEDEGFEPNPIVNSREVDINTLSDVPDAEKYFKINPTMSITKGTVFTIAEVKINKPAMVDKDGKDLAETNGKGNKYYKGRIEIRFVETIDGMKLHDFVSGLYWSVDKNTNELRYLPAIPKAAGDLNDKFTSDLSKLRAVYCNFKKLDPKNLSDKSFLKGLVGMKISTERETGKNPKTGKDYIKLKILGFTA